MTKIKVLDLFCGAGGCSTGYYQYVGAQLGMMLVRK